MDRQTEGHGWLSVVGLSPAGMSLTCSNPPASLRRRRRACTSDGRAGTRCRRTSKRLPLLLRLPSPEPPNSPPTPPSFSLPIGDAPILSLVPVTPVAQRTSCSERGLLYCKTVSPASPMGSHQPHGDPISPVGIPPAWGHAGGTQQHPSAHLPAGRSMEGQTPLTISSSAPSCSPGRRWPR